MTTSPSNSPKDVYAVANDLVQWFQGRGISPAYAIKVMACVITLTSEKLQEKMVELEKGKK